MAGRSDAPRDVLAMLRRCWLERTSLCGDLYGDLYGEGIRALRLGHGAGVDPGILGGTLGSILGRTGRCGRRGDRWETAVRRRRQAGAELRRARSSGG